VPAVARREGALDELLETASVGDFAQYDRKWRANPHRGGEPPDRQESVLRWSKRALGVTIADELFSPEALLE
jgi:hypothetical protein